MRDKKEDPCVIIISAEPVGINMSGPGIRCWEFAKVLSASNKVILAIPNKPSLTFPSFEIVTYDSTGQVLRDILPEADILILQGMITFYFPFLLDNDKFLIFDLYNPSFFENLEAYANIPNSDKELMYSFNLEIFNEQLRIGDFFICANERQRSFWLGLLTANGRINHITYSVDKTLKSLIDVVPFGLPAKPPQHTKRVLKGVVRNINKNDKVILWGGGIWKWLDPFIVIEAMAHIVKKRSDLKLFFMSKSVFDTKVSKEVKIAKQAVELSERLGLKERSVFFNEAWVPYQERQNYLIEADVGIVAHLDHLETYFSNRTRILDYIWAELPIVTTKGDSLSEMVEKYGLGKVVEHDAKIMAEAILEVLEVPRAYYRHKFQPLASQLSWDKVTEPLVRFCQKPYKAPDKDVYLKEKWQDEMQRSIARRERVIAELSEALAWERLPFWRKLQRKVRKELFKKRERISTWPTPLHRVEKVDVSIIILTKNGEKYIDEVMNAVFSQQTKYTYEVIVIDSGSKDGTLRILNKYPVKLFQIPPGDFNHGETRNLGANYSSNGVKYLVYLSQDATPIDDWLDNLIRPLEEDQKIAGAFSRQIPRKDCVPSIARLMTTEWIQLGTPERVVKKIEDLEEYERNKPFYAFFSNTSSCLRKSVWQKYPFSRIDFAEDAEWADRVLRAGYTLVYEPQSAVIHSHNYSLWQQLSQNFDHAKAMKEIFDPEAYRKGFPFRTFRIVLEQILRDFIYIKKLQAPAFKKLYWLLYTPLWHLATQAGSFLGSRYEGLPYILINFLSRQRRLKRR